jgi:diphthine-ammonia ligase
VCKSLRIDGFVRCIRLGLTPLAYLWQRHQTELMAEMIEYGMHSVLIKVASLGLNEKHLLKSLQEMQPLFLSLHDQYGSHVCGEGGEYETLTLDAPYFKKRIVM